MTTQLELGALKDQIMSYLEGQYASTAITNSAPVLSRPIPTHNGISLTGQFSTNDATATGRPLYVTVLRQTGSTSVHDGYGFAIFRGNESFNSPTQYDTYNLFLVDNNVLTDAIRFGGDLLSGSNVNQFISAAKFQMLINTTYEFEMKIKTDWSIELRIWASGGTYPTIATISSGALVDGPLGAGGPQLQDPVTGNFLNITTGKEVGFGVSNPSGYIWTISNFQITKIAGGIPLQIYEFTNANISTDGIIGQVQLTYYGSGQVTATSNPNTIMVSGLDFYIAMVNNPNNPSNPIQNTLTPWEYLGSNYANNSASLSVKRFIGVTQHTANYYQFNGMFYIAVTKNFTPLGVSGINLSSASISTNYIEVSDVRIKQVIDRKAVDIWIDPLNFLQKDSVTVILGNAGIEQQISNIKTPVFYVESIAFSSTPNVNILNYLPTVGVAPINHYNGLLYSLSDIFGVEFPASMAFQEVIITYYHVNTEVTGLQNFISQSTFRSPGTDPLIRVLPPVVLYLTTPLFYKGNISVADLQTAVAGFVNSLPYNGTIRKSDLISFIYNSGVSYIDFTSLHFYLNIFDYKDLWIGSEELVDTYTLASSPCRFYTNATYLNFTKIG